MLDRKTTAPRGILHIPSPESMIGLERFEASQPLRPFIEHYWCVTWECQPKTLRETVPHPAVHMVFERNHSQVHGIHLRRFSRWIEGSGRVLGVKFRPGGFRPFYRQEMRFLTNTISTPETLFGRAINQLESEVVELDTAKLAFHRIDTFLDQLQPEATLEMELVNQVIKTMEAGPNLLRVDSVAEQFGLGIRKLQRLFMNYVGVSPKWVVQRYRLIEAAERMRGATIPLDFTGLALELGYSDQSHFIRDFKVMVGMTPAKYFESLKQEASEQT